MPGLNRGFESSLRPEMSPNPNGVIVSLVHLISRVFVEKGKKGTRGDLGLRS